MKKYNLCRPRQLALGRNHRRDQSPRRVQYDEWNHQAPVEADQALHRAYLKSRRALPTRAIAARLDIGALC